MKQLLKKLSKKLKKIDDTSIESLIQPGETEYDYINPEELKIKKMNTKPIKNPISSVQNMKNKK